MNAREDANQPTADKPKEPSVLEDLGEISFLILIIDYVS